MLEVGAQNMAQAPYQGKGNIQGRNWNKNPRQRQRKQYFLFYGEEKGHVTRD
jgi:hypothetical protein